MIPLLIFVAVIVTTLLVAVSQYNRLVRARQMAQEGLSGIDVQLKRRADLIPNLIETVKGYMGHERQVLERVTELRAQSLKAGTLAEKGQVEGMLSRALGNLFAVAENYPDLKASTNFLDLQKSLADVEEQLQLSRRYYNGAVRALNILVESFPSNIIARMFAFTHMEYFELEDQADRAVPQVKFS
uniref:LemA family protein n=1 Tax=Desulfobacca acetoxidans TaxID=60893 RepID=A0A7V4G8B8_9BACT